MPDTITIVHSDRRVGSCDGGPRRGDNLTAGAGPHRDAARPSIRVTLFSRTGSFKSPTAVNGQITLKQLFGVYLESIPSGAKEESTPTGERLHHNHLLRHLRARKLVRSITKATHFVNVIATGEQLAVPLHSLSDEQPFVLLSTLQGRSHCEIAEDLRKSERIVRRRLAEGRERFEQTLLGEPGRKGPERVRVPTLKSDASTLPSAHTMVRAIP